MKAFTVRQPYGLAIARGWKPVENRKQLSKFRGPVMVHTSQQLAGPEGLREVEELAPEPVQLLGGPGAVTELTFGAVIAVAQLVDVHHADECGGCSPWAHQGAGHHMLDHVRILRRPVPARGQLGLWTPDADLIAAVKGQMP